MQQHECTLPVHIPTIVAVAHFRTDYSCSVRRTQLFHITMMAEPEKKKVVLTICFFRSSVILSVVACHNIQVTAVEICALTAIRFRGFNTFDYRLLCTLQLYMQNT